MSHYSSILVGVDLHHGDRAASAELGRETRAAIEQALELAAHSGGTVTFCSVLEISPQTASLIERDHENLLKTVEDFASELLDAEVSAANRRGIAADKVIRFGAAWEELVKEVSENQHHVVVMGTRPRDAASRLLFGSTAQKVIRLATCPVWIVKPDEVREIREIAVATDLGESSLPILHAGIEAARAWNARLYLLHILELDQLSYLLIAGVSEDEIAACQQRLRSEAEAKLHAQLAQCDYRTLQQGVKIEIVLGSPDREIGRFVTANEVDLLVIGTHGRRGLEAYLLGNTAERILPSIEASLLVIKPAS